MILLTPPAVGFKGVVADECFLNPRSCNFLCGAAVFFQLIAREMGQVAV
jgi:hypothetical protein